MHHSLFRKPNFDNIQAGEASPEGLLTFIEQRRHGMQLEFNETVGLDETIEEEGSSEEVIVVEELDKKSASKETNANTSKQDHHDDQKEGIAMLEPHIAAFRKRMNEDVYMNVAQNKGGDGDGNHDDKFLASNIPPQLLRIVRFFPFKWIPLKRALLRHPTANEVGRTTRLSLAKALHTKKLLSTAEYDLLEQSFVNEDTNIENSTKNRKRRRDQRDISNELKMVFSRLPLDVGKHCSMRHMKTVLNDYINIINTAQDEIETVTLPKPEDVAEWALLSFCGTVVANGLDEPHNSDSPEYVMESQMVALFTSENAHNQVFARAVKGRVKAMLEHPIIDKLSNLNMLCLARFISYMDGTVVELLFTHAIIKNSDYGCGSGYSSIPKLMAAYFSIVMRRNAGFSLTSFQSKMKDHLMRPNHSETESKRIMELASAIFCLAQNLVTKKTASF